MSRGGKFSFCKAKITSYDDIQKLKKGELEMDELRNSLPNIPFIHSNQAADESGNISRRRRPVLKWENINPKFRESLLNFLEEKRTYYPDRKVKILGKFFKFNDRPKPSPLFTKKLLEKKTLTALKGICKTYNISVSNKGKMEIVSAIMRYQRKGDIGKKERCFDGMPVSLLEPLDSNGFSFNDYDFNSEDNSDVSTD